MFKKINEGRIECDDGIVIRLHRQHVSYIKDDYSIMVYCEYMTDGKLVVYGGDMEYQDPRYNKPIQPDIEMQVLERIRNVLNFLEVEYEIENT